MNKKILLELGMTEKLYLIQNNCCPFCKEKIDIKSFKDSLSVKEYEISGLCQNCQDKIF
jgi:hypothetical protein